MTLKSTSYHKKYVIMSNVRHNGQTYAMTSKSVITLKSTFKYYKVPHKVKKYVMVSTNMSLRQQARHDVK